MHAPTEPEPLVIDVFGDGAISTGAAAEPIALDTATAVAAAVRAGNRGQPVVVRGDVRSRLGRPVVDAVVAAVPVAQVRRARQPRPKGWLALDLAFSDRPDAADLRTDLLERATSAGAVRHLIRVATKYCCPDAARTLRSLAGRPGPPIAPGAGPYAVSLQTPTWPFLAYFSGFVLLFWVLFLFSENHGAGLVIGMALVPIVIGALTLVMAGGYWQRTCFDGSSVWVKHLGRPWRGPIDLRRIDAYREFHTYKRSMVSLYEPAVDGEVTRFRGPGFSPADAERLERQGHHRAVVVHVTRSHLYHGLARHIRRYVDLDRCHVVPGPVWASPG